MNNNKRVALFNNIKRDHLKFSTNLLNAYHQMRESVLYELYGNDAYQTLFT